MVRLPAGVPLLLLLLLLRARPAHAESGRVVLLEPAVRSAAAHRCITRIREELIAGGFVVAVVDPGPRTDPIAMASAMEQQREALATIALLGDPDAGSSELWILDRVGAEAQVRRIPVPTDEPDRAPEVLAIRTIELLRASALKLLVESSRAAHPASPPPIPPVDREAETPVRPRAPHVTFGLEMGISSLDSPAGDIGLAALPVGKVTVPVSPHWFGRFTLAGLGTRPRVETLRGSAAIGQLFALAELGARFRPGLRLQPTVSLGAGMLRVQVEGQGIFPYRGLSDSRVVAVADGGAGVLAGFGGQLALAAEVHALWAFPRPAVQFIDLEAGTIGGPSVLASLTLVVWL